MLFVIIILENPVSMFDSVALSMFVLAQPVVIIAALKIVISVLLFIGLLRLTAIAILYFFAGMVYWQVIPLWTPMSLFSLKDFAMPIKTVIYPREVIRCCHLAVSFVLTLCVDARMILSTGCPDQSF